MKTTTLCRPESWQRAKIVLTADAGRAAEAGAYNGLITAWPNLRTGTATVAAAAAGPAQQALL